MRYYAENKETKEVYDCNVFKLFADVASYYRVSREEAREMLDRTNIDNPLDLPDCIVWKEK